MLQSLAHCEHYWLGEPTQTPSIALTLITK